MSWQWHTLMPKGTPASGERLSGPANAILSSKSRAARHASSEAILMKLCTLGSAACSFARYS